MPGARALPGGAEVPGGGGEELPGRCGVLNGGAVCGAAAHNRGMNLIAIVLGILAILLVILTAILPVIGAIFSWLALVIGVIGLVFGLLSKNTSGRNISIVACVLAGFRLALGGGVI